MTSARHRLDPEYLHDPHTIEPMPVHAFPLLIKVVSDLVGVPHADRDRTAAILDAKSVDAVEDKRANPGHDLVRAGDDGDRLDAGELVAMISLLLTAGHETTANLIGNGVSALLRHPDQPAALRADGPPTPPPCASPPSPCPSAEWSSRPRRSWTSPATPPCAWRSATASTLRRRPVRPVVPFDSLRWRHSMIRGLESLRLHDRAS